MASLAKGTRGHPSASGGLSPVPPPCKFYASGTCARGTACKFMHDVKNLATNNKKKTICKYFLQGTCSKGKFCQFRHSQKSKAANVKSGSSAWSSLSSIARVPVNGLARAKPTAPLRHGDEKKWTSGKEYDRGDDDFFFYGAVSHFSEKKSGSPTKKSAVDFSKIIELEGRTMASQTMLVEPSGGQYASRPQSICPFHAQGYCRFGKACKLLHCTEEAAVQEEVNNSKHLECGICFDAILGNGRRFGLLLGCNHSFCLSCIRSWRQNEEQTFDKNAVRKCPVCRVPTFFIVPSNRMIADPARKRQVVNEYLKQLKSKTCLYYKRDGACPFGTSCFYAHIGKNGARVEYEPPRLMVDEHGEIQKIFTPMLSEFL